MGHANMRLRVFVVTTGDFEQWAAHQAAGDVYTGPPPAPPPAPCRPGAARRRSAARATLDAPGLRDARARSKRRRPRHPDPRRPSCDTTAVFPRDQIPAYAIPATPTPEGLTFTPGLAGDPARGLKTFSAGLCIGCHTIKGNPMAQSPIGPESHAHCVALHDRRIDSIRTTRNTCGSGSRTPELMKAGVIMPTLGTRPVRPADRSMTVTTASGGLTDQQIADIVAYLQALK